MNKLFNSAYGSSRSIFHNELTSLLIVILFILGSLVSVLLEDKAIGLVLSVAVVYHSVLFIYRNASVKF